MWYHPVGISLDHPLGEQINKLEKNHTAYNALLPPAFALRMPKMAWNVLYVGCGPLLALQTGDGGGAKGELSPQSLMITNSNHEISIRSRHYPRWKHFRIRRTLLGLRLARHPSTGAIAFQNTAVYLSGYYVKESIHRDRWFHVMTWTGVRSHQKLRCGGIELSFSGQIRGRAHEPEMNLRGDHSPQLSTSSTPFFITPLKPNTVHILEAAKAVWRRLRIGNRHGRHHELGHLHD